MSISRQLQSLLLVLLCLPATARGACNLIPQASPAFRATRGTIDRPFAAPGDFVDLIYEHYSPGEYLLTREGSTTLSFVGSSSP